MAEAYIPFSKLPLTCPVCMDRVNQPRSLPCLHTLCTTCLQAHIDIALQNSFMTSFPCPICRNVTKPPKPFLRRETWAEQFPTNYILLSLIDEAVEIDPKPGNKGHMCDKHNEFKISLFCKDHQSLCCPMCVATEHRKCNEVKEISELLSEYDIDAEKSNVDSVLLGMKTALSEEAENTSDEKMQLTDDYEQAKLAVSDVTADAIDHLKYLQEKALDEIEQRHDDALNTVLENGQRIEVAQTIYEGLKTTLGQFDDNERGVEAFIKLGKAKTTLKEIQGLIDANSAGKTTMHRFVFDVNVDIETIHELESIGTVQDAHESGLDDNDDTNDEAISTGDQVSQLEAEGSTEFNVDKTSFNNRSADTSRLSPLCSNSLLQVVGHLREDTPVNVYTADRHLTSRNTWLTSAVALRHRIIVACNHTERSLQLYWDLREIYSCKGRTAPWSLATVSREQFAVTYPQENRIRMFEVRYSDSARKLLNKPRFVGESFKQLKEIATGTPCYGICVVNKRLVVACESCVKVFTRGGNFVQKLTCTGDDGATFTRAVGVAADEFRSILYITDEGRHAVLALRINEHSIEGGPMFVYTSEHLRNPQGVAVSGVGKVFVCGFSSKNIHVLHSSGQCLQILESVERPWNISANIYSSELIVTFYPDDANERRITSGVYKIL